MSVHDLIFGLRAADQAKVATFAAALNKWASELAGELEIEILGYDIAEAWVPPAHCDGSQLAFENNRILDNSISPNKDD